MAQLWGSIQTSEAQQRLLQALSGLIRQEITHLRIPIDAASQFEPSQIGTIIGTLTDALLPHIALSLGGPRHRPASPNRGDAGAQPDRHAD